MKMSARISILGGIRAPLVALVLLPATLPSAAIAHDEIHPLKTVAGFEDNVVARVNGTVITGDDFRAAFDALPPESQLPARRSPTALLTSLIHHELIYQAAAEAGLDRDPAIARKLERAWHEILVREMALRLRRAVEVSDEAAQQYYDGHPELFNTPERISASHILLESREDAERVLARIKDGGDFADLAQEHSRDARTRGLGGRIFTITPGQMTPEFERAAFALRPGEISEIVQDRDGYHVITLHERAPAVVIPFEAVKEKVRQRLAFEQGQQRLRDLVIELEKKARIEVNEKALGRVK